MRLEATYVVTLFGLLVQVVHGSSLDKDTALRQQILHGLDRKWVSSLLNEMLSGPLKGRRVTIILKTDTVSGNFRSDDVLEGVDHSFYLLQLPGEIPSAILESYHVREDPPRNSSRADVSHSYQLVPSVVIFVILSDDPYWWPFWMPPKDWEVREVVLIASLPLYSKESYLNTPLLKNPSSLAVVCPYKTQGMAEGDMPLKVWTSRPLAAESNFLLDLGIWSHVSFTSWDHLFIDRFKDMTRKNMTVICWPYERPLVYFFNGALKGVNYYILDVFSKWLHFNLSYVTEGYVAFSSILEEVKRDKCDVFINPAIMTPERLEEFDLTVPYLTQGYGIFLEVPPPLPRWQSILYPFSWIVWGLILFSIICTATMYHILNKENNVNLLSNFVTIMQGLLSEPVDHVPDSWKLRNFLLVWWITAWFINTSYMSNLIAVLTAPVFPVRMQTAKELLESHYRLCYLDFGDFIDESLAASSNPVLFGLSEILDVYPLQFDWEHVGEEQCIEKVLAGTHAHTDTFSFTYSLYNLLGHGRTTYVFKEQLYPGYLVLVLKKNTPWKYKFDQGMEWLIEAGIVDKWYEDCMNDFLERFDKNEREELHTLSLSHLQGAFMILGIGHFLGCILMALEVFFPHSLKFV